MTMIKKIFIYGGVIGYENDTEHILLKNTTIDKALPSIIDKPIHYTHEGQKEVGKVIKAYFDNDNKEYIAECEISDENIVDLLTHKGWGVSCVYNINKKSEGGGTDMGMRYDYEATDIDFISLDVVENPRFADALKKVNASDVIKKNVRRVMAIFKKNENESESAQPTKENGGEALQEVKETLDNLIEALVAADVIEEIKEEGEQVVENAECGDDKENIGTATSGNYGHDGRPGLVGGSKVGGRKQQLRARRRYAAKYSYHHNENDVIQKDNVEVDEQVDVKEDVSRLLSDKVDEATLAKIKSLIDNGYKANESQTENLEQKLNNMDIPTAPQEYKMKLGANRYKEI